MGDTGSGGEVNNCGEDDNDDLPQIVTIISVDSSSSSSQPRPSLIKSASTPGKPNYVRQHPQLNRAQSIKERLTNETARFFGVPPLGDDGIENENSVQVRLSTDEEERKWQQRRFRHLKKQYAIKTDAIAEELQSKIGIDTLMELTDGGTDAAETPTTSRQESGIVSENVSSPDRKRRSVEAANSRLLRTCILPNPSPIERRKSVIKMACDTIGSILHGDYFRRFKRNRSLSTVNAANANNHFSLEPPLQPPKFHLHSSSSPEKAFDGSVTAIAIPSAEGEALTNGSRNGSATSRVLAGGVLLSHYAETAEFLSSSVLTSSGMNGGGGNIPTSPSYKSIRQRPTVFGFSSFFTGQKSSSIIASNRGSAGGYPIMADASTTSSSVLGICVGSSSSKSSGSGISSERRTTGRLAYRKLHQRSLPIFGKMVAWQLNDESCDYRPFFTYWITTVQTIIMLFMMFNYGIGSDFTSGFGVIERSGNVEASYSSTVHIVVWEQNNIWIGPRFADLVHAGAKYTPCMRLDPSIHEQIQRERIEESQHTGCCIGPNGCHQTSECPKQFARLVKWTDNNAAQLATNEADNPITTRVVCGQDPRFCLNPRSLFPFEWDRIDIAKWPICEKRTVHIPRAVEHMHCEITGRPCCIQMHGQCRITTREYCDFVRGYYHPNATLCSQVSCLNDVCGMTSFSSPDRPDQLFRLVIPLFIHAGIVRCVITIALQMSIMREFETMIGWFRLSIIYFASGIGGYLASAVFVPYMPEVGPAGSQGGVLGALIVNVIYNWNFLRRPHRVMAFHVAIAVLLFITGLLPYVDNWAQLFGFVFGCLFAAALIPYITFGRPRTRRRRRVLVVVGSLGLTLSLFLVLFSLFFYANPSSSWLNYELLSLMNCPFSSKVCDQQSLTLRSWLPI